MSYYPPDIIDNSRADRTLSHHLTQAIVAGEQHRLDIATGYFAPQVWNLVGDALAQLHLFRLLIGESPSVGHGVDATLNLRQMFRHKLAEDIAAMGFDREHAKLVDQLVAFLQRDDVGVRQYSGAFLHAKAYILDHMSFVGSSNFTPAGLTRNSELSLSNMTESSVQSLRAWFETKWAVGVDYKTDLIETLQVSKFGTKAYSPFEVFIKALYEYFKDRLLIDNNQQATVELARFQEEGKLEAINLLDKWGGVIVADAVGLGKTFIGLSLLEHELVGKRRRGHVPHALLICPAQLRDLVWRPRIQEFSLPGVEIRSQEELGSQDFDWKKYAHSVDLVLVDESHNFRNPNTNRADHLMRLVSTGKKKRVVLMTATPVNNSIFDLYQQIRYLTHGNDHHYRQLGILNLRSYFKAAQQAGLDIFELLEATTVRRSRADIRRRQAAGDAVVINGQPVHFPDRLLERIDYDLDQTYHGFYRDIVAEHRTTAFNRVQRAGIRAHPQPADAPRGSGELRPDRADEDALPQTAGKLDCRIFQQHPPAARFPTALSHFAGAGQASRCRQLSQARAPRHRRRQ